MLTAVSMGILLSGSAVKMRLLSSRPYRGLKRYRHSRGRPAVPRRLVLLCLWFALRQQEEMVMLTTQTRTSALDFSTAVQSYRR